MQREVRRNPMEASGQGGRAAPLGPLRPRPAQHGAGGAKDTAQGAVLGALHNAPLQHLALVELRNLTGSVWLGMG